MKVLVIQQKMIGDVLVSSLLCEHLRMQLPEAVIHYLVNDYTTAVVEHNPFIDHLQIFRKEFRKKPAAFYSFLRKISQEKYDVVIDIYAKPESRLITLFSGAGIRISYRKGLLGMLYTHLLPIKSKDAENRDTTIDDRLSLLSPLVPGIPDPGLRPRIFLTPLEIEEAANMLMASGIAKDRHKIMLGILGSDPSKTYPLSYMVKVIDMLAKYTDAALLFNYTPAQEVLAEKVYRFCSQETKPRIYLQTFTPDLRKLLTVLYHCHCYVGNEGGVVNMAKALAIPTFAIFAPWIHKKGWHTYADHSNIGIHVKDYFPQEYSSIGEREVKKESDRLYIMLDPTLFEGELLTFLKTTRTIRGSD